MMEVLNCNHALKLERYLLLQIKRRIQSFETFYVVRSNDEACRTKLTYGLIAELLSDAAFVFRLQVGCK